MLNLSECFVLKITKIWEIQPSFWASKFQLYQRLKLAKNVPEGWVDNVVNAIINRIPTKTLQTPYGVKHIYHTTLVGKNGNHIKANVVVVVQKDNKRITYKIVTVYPDKKER